VPLIVSNIRQLGFKVEDIRLIVNSHAHFDHAGGIAELQKLSGARVVASRWTANVMRKGIVPHDDPQYGTIIGIAPVSKAETLKDGETLLTGNILITAHSTPGHTPGGTSWTWRSCEQSRCLNFLYADSITAVSAEGFRFSQRKEAIAGFERSYEFLENTPCDILITPHPDTSNLWERFDQRKSNPEAFVDHGACRRLAAVSRKQLQQRLDSEKKP
jgi:metallo-beta-lactamase class B